MLPSFLRRVGSASLRAAPRLQRLCQATTAPLDRAPAALLFAGALGAFSAGAVACAAGPTLHAEADALFDKNEYAPLVSVLRDGLASDPDDAQLLWRLARALKKQADAEPARETKKAMLHEALALAQKAIELDPGCGSAHKWCGPSRGPALRPLGISPGFVLYISCMEDLRSTDLIHVTPKHNNTTHTHTRTHALNNE